MTTTRPPSVLPKHLPHSSNGGPSRSVPRGKQIAQERAEVPLKGIQVNGNTSENAQRQSADGAKRKMAGPTLNTSVPSCSIGEAGTTDQVKQKDDQSLQRPSFSTRGKLERLRLGGLTEKMSASTAPTSLSASSGSPSSEVLPPVEYPPPLPARSGYVAQFRSMGPPMTADPTPQTEAMVRPYTLEPPSIAPQFLGDGRADFYPWTGNHPEDVLSEQIIKSGYSDKHPVSEVQSARSILWPIMKHKGGLQILSSSVVSVLEKKQSIGRITAPSTFKPPPRVTLTDTKREAWLRDLANPAIPLRRLSRTIPHGVRGKVLLEHCLNKNIPAERAIWLAKCVGANEMRAFKRKGVNGAFAMGGEAKWVRDWTIFVEQFVESVVGLCGEEGWKNRMTYVIRLSAQLFAEKLLDEDHFLDWLLTSLDSASLDTLPVWILIVQPYLSNIVRYRTSGTRLMAIFLEKLQFASDSDNRGTFFPLMERLSQLIASVMFREPANLVSTRIWPKYCTTVPTNLGSSGKALYLIGEIRRRNERLASATARPSITDSAKRRLHHILDQLPCDIRMDEISSQCLDMIKDQGTLLYELLEWATSIYREDVSRVYLAATLIRKWRSMGLDTDSGILNFLAQSRNLRCCNENVYLLVSELVCTNHFPVGQYLQWLIARGALNYVQSLEVDCPCEVRLLAELPSCGLPIHLLNLRRTLLRRVGYSTEDEHKTLLRTKSALAVLAPEILSYDGSTEVDMDMEPDSTITWISGLSRTIKSELSRWIHEQMTLRIKDSKALDQERQKGGVVVEPWSITVLHFVIIRSILEGMRELSVLADIIGLVSGSRNPMVLSSLADTLNYHRTAFEVMGTLQISFETLLQRYQSLRAVKVTDPSLLRSLADLAIRIPRAQHIGRHLHSELNGNVYKGSIAAFSPVSNPTIEMSQSAESDFHEEIERLLSTGTSIDQQTLTRLFKDIITRLEHISNRQISMDSSCYINNLLVKLRCLDTRGFDELMDAWISHVMKSKPSLTFFHALESMVVSGCLLLGSVTACSVKFLQSKAGTDIELAQAEVAMGTLQLITSAASNIVDQEQYRLQLLQSQFAIDHPTEWLAVLHQAIECVSLAESSNLMTRLKNLLANKANIYRLRTLVIGNTQEVCDGVVMPLLKKAGSLVGELIDILDPATEPYTTKDNGSDAKSQLAEVVHQVNHLSLPFCKIKVLGLCITEAEDESQSSLLETFLEEAQKLDGLANDVFTELIGVLASHQLRQINELAQARLMDCLMRLETSVRPTVKGSERPKTEQGIIQLYLSIIQTTAHRLQQSAILEMGSALTSRLNQLVRILNEDRQKKISHITERRRSQTINLHVTVLLHLILLYRNISLSTSKCISADHNRIAIYLNAILLLLLDSTYIIPSLTEYTHDVLAQLIDDLPDDHRRQCINFLKDKPSHPLVRYLFSIADGSETESKLYITGSSSSSRTAQRQPTMHGSGASGGGGSSSNVTNSKKASTTTTTTTQPLQLRHWELLSEPTPVMGENDTSLNLKLFGARKC